MKIKQIVILSLTFILPISIFIFLKTMGKNEFAVAPFYEDGTIPVETSCGIEYKTPYTVPENVLIDLQWSQEDSLTLYVFEAMPFDEKALTVRLADDFSGNELELHKIITDSASVNTSEDVEPIIKDPVTVEQLQECFFIMEKIKMLCCWISKEEFVDTTI